MLKMRITAYAFTAENIPMAFVNPTRAGTRADRAI